jgi:Domain of unknown function (DUF932)
VLSQETDAERIEAMELMKASHQWSSRPDDEKFATLEELHSVAVRFREQAFEVSADFSDMRADKRDGDVVLVGKQGIPARMTHWAFGQVCALASCPADYLRRIPPTLAVQNLNHGLADRLRNVAAEKMANMLFNDGAQEVSLHAVNTDRYSRIWDSDITERALDLQTKGWKPAGVDIRQKSNDNRENFDLYKSDHDVFIFLHRSDLTIEERGSTDAIYKGIIIENSEVGASSLKVTRFLYREKCGNHIIWGASNVCEIKVRHVGQANLKWHGYLAEIQHYANESVSDVEAKIRYAQTRMLSTKPGKAGKEEVLDAIFGRRTDLSKRAIEGGFDAVKPEEDGDPRSLWGFVQGLTRFSQTLKFADERTKIDRAAGRLLANGF